MININWYPGHMAKTKRLIKENLEVVDLVLEVVDARIPYSSKLPDLDDYINDKLRIMVMTKYDLCDKYETNKWVKYYENNGYKVITYDLENNPNMNKLMTLINEAVKPLDEQRKAKDLLKRRTRILIVGIPNAGKSTLINRLVGKKATVVGNKPGVTKQLSWIRINEDLELLDTPGILWPKLEKEKVAFNLASLTAIKEEILPLYDVIEYILRTLEKYYPQLLQERYGINSVNDDIIETLDIVGKKRGCLIKGGEIDYDKVISVIMNDIKMNLIKGITFDRIEDYDK
jgi:ribosome biogenesis GTPase A